MSPAGEVSVLFHPCRNATHQHSYLEALMAVSNHCCTIRVTSSTRAGRSLQISARKFNLDPCDVRTLRTQGTPLAELILTLTSGLQSHTSMTSNAK